MSVCSAEKKVVLSDRKESFACGGENGDGGVTVL